MTARPELMREVGRWVRKAENDLRNADYVLTLEDDCPVDTVCFHCQQCAEKYLKALLLLRGVAFPRTHDLVVLLNLSKQEFALGLDIARVQPLNRYGMEARYPGCWAPISREEAGEAAAMAHAVRAAVRSHLPPECL